MNANLLKLIDRLSLPLDERAARRSLRDFADDTGFDFYAYLYLRGPESFAVSNYPRAWQELYVQREFIRVDPVVTKAKHGPPLFSWSAGEARRNGRRDVIKFFVEADRFGIRSGISISIPVGFRDRMVFTLASGRPVSKLSEDIDPVTAAVSVAFVHSRLGGASGDASLASGIRLSPREAECLRWFAEGMSMADIALMLDISYRSVRSYIDEATNKLGAANNRQAGTIATRIGLI
ncbi:autoinducer binding domain-containing protein [Neoaquamicrobium sediminum]|uniref:Autoinducer binding domain-containing protein n=1 Tax=Neoaquamicrobium sediminum TaxID=1849104 RepID=A0ABV3WYP4_9HYPH|nr:autoinducer binding domain-containing protein [Mesorhizobium sediminum]MCV0398223.1 autoinducer binding domain-containing protein [Rhizobiaceae bacterium]MCV0406773.1 autoinducer binding domain-containing protein [Rhizobiaceae bacterium]NRC57046.1 LuxR family transcriptional regulator [Mesorhizobium sediminum]